MLYYFPLMVLAWKGWRRTRHRYVVRRRGILQEFTGHFSNTSTCQYLLHECTLTHHHIQMRGSNSGLLLMDYSSGHGNTTRFSLPIDLQTLESECHFNYTTTLRTSKYISCKLLISCAFIIVNVGMTPTDYLHSHCIIR